MNEPPQSQVQEIRHAVADRLFHWVMAASVIVLGASAFLPILGVKFDWIPIHWISGIVLTAAVLFHLWRALVVHGLSEMLPKRADVTMIRRDLLLQRVPDEVSGKFDIFQKLYHWAVAVIILLLVATGLIMLLKIDTQFWNRNPSILSEASWGIVYVTHGASALVLIFLFILHLYFSFLPEHRALLSSMVLGSGPRHAHQPQDEGQP
ncbi:MAG: cytochrome b/b6 domain-containing protein [Hyphomicrobiaceae bacterium]